MSRKPKPQVKARQVRALTTTTSDLISVVKQIASEMDPRLVASLELRDHLGCESIAKELGISATEARELLLAKATVAMGYGGQARPALRMNFRPRLSTIDY